MTIKEFSVMSLAELNSEMTFWLLERDRNPASGILASLYIERIRVWIERRQRAVIMSRMGRGAERARWRKKAVR